MPDTKNIIAEAMENPRKGTIDNQSFEQHSISDLIKAQNYLDSARAGRKKGFGIKIAKLSAGGAV